jgi:DNA polymerase-3 subunit alpha
MPVPMPTLDLQAAEIPTKEKLAWEKELMGVYLSEHPFASFARKIGSEAILCGQVDAELAGQTIMVVGMVASVHYLFTRDGNPFIRAMLEDLDGRVEVMVWSKVYASTKDLWQEGSILQIAGKVRLRDERVQLNCDNVRSYQLEAAQGEEVVAPHPREVPEVVEEATAYAAPPESRRLVISLTQTADVDGDTACLRKVVDTLKDFPGQDEVKLRVTNGEKIINLKLSNLYTNYCPELRERLVELVGEDGLRLDNK